MTEKQTKKPAKALKMSLSLATVIMTSQWSWRHFHCFRAMSKCVVWTGRSHRPDYTLWRLIWPQLGNNTPRWMSLFSVLPHLPLKGISNRIWQVGNWDFAKRISTGRDSAKMHCQGEANQIGRNISTCEPWATWQPSGVLQILTGLGSRQWDTSVAVKLCSLCFSS